MRDGTELFPAEGNDSKAAIPVSGAKIKKRIEKYGKKESDDS